MTIYLDFNATTPMDPRVQVEVSRCFSEEWGNPGSSHEFGQRAKEVVHAARDRIATVVSARRHDVIFTSGATESNNLALLGLEQYGRETNRRHVVSTQIEHKSVLEPIEILRQRGFEVTLVPPQLNGRMSADAMLAVVRPDTLLVSMMHVNNETGGVQPVAELAEQLQGRDVWFHVDAAQGFGKELVELQHERIDSLSISSHKIYGPPGVGALVVRHRRHQPIPLSPLMYGGGQELGLRPGTLPTSLIHGFGLAAEFAQHEHAYRATICREIRRQLIHALEPLGGVIHGDSEHTLPHVLNISFPGIDGDDVVEAFEGIAAVATGSACTSVCATASHVLTAMRVPSPELDGAVRFSWSHAIDRTRWTTGLNQMVQRLMFLVRQSFTDP